MPTAQTAEFKKAVEDSRKLKAKPSDDELLQVRWEIADIKMDVFGFD